MAFETLIGNQKVKTLLENTVKSNNVLHSYLFTGIEGIGKNLFAKEFAKMILETKFESHPDLLQIDPEDGKTIKIEQIRFLQEKIAEKPVTSQKKVYIINKCDTMTREASNALLKTLEEPPAYAVLILITDNESKLLVTIKSRCTKIAFNSISEEEIKEYINTNLSHMTSSMIKQCQGSIGKLLKISDEYEIYSDVEKIIENLQKDDITEIWKESEVLYKEKERILDLLDYINVLFFEKLRTKKDIRCTKAVEIVEEAKKRIISNANYDMTIDNLLLKLWEEFS